jgi:hypothetical protein
VIVLVVMLRPCASGASVMSLRTPGPRVGITPDTA